MFKASTSANMAFHKSWESLHHISMCVGEWCVLYGSRYGAYNNAHTHITHVMYEADIGCNPSKPPFMTKTPIKANKNGGWGKVQCLVWPSAMSQSGALVPMNAVRLPLMGMRAAIRVAGFPRQTGQGAICLQSRVG